MITAFYRMESLELWAKITINAVILGGSRDISEENIQKLIDLRSFYRITGRHPGYKMFNPNDALLHKKEDWAMLKGISPLISPALLKALCEMGHGDELVIADGNFPAESIGKNAVVIRADGHGAAEILDAVLQLIPLDTYVGKPVALMEVVPGDNCPAPAVWEKYRKILGKHEPQHSDIQMMERFAFYERAKNAYLIIATGETAIYANILLKKGVVKI